MWTTQPQASSQCLRIAEARQALEFLERAELWAAGVDERVVDDLVRAHTRLERLIDALEGPARRVRLA